jgi:1-phosphofructokinase
MIYTLTMNPAVDYILEVDSLASGGLNRAKSHRFERGGKGDNVLAALKSLGTDCAAIPSGVKPRVNVKIRSSGGVTEINGSSFADKNAVRGVIESVARLSAADWLIIGGSLPDGCEPSFYAGLVALSKARVIVDTSGEPLRQVAEQGLAWMIAPNEQEFAELGECNCKVLLSLGERGAELRVGDAAYVCAPPKVCTSGYAVGAGDTLLAGFIAEYVKSGDYEKALSAGVKLAGDYVCRSGYQE